MSIYSAHWNFQIFMCHFSLSCERVKETQWVFHNVMLDIAYFFYLMHGFESNFFMFSIKTYHNFIFSYKYFIKYKKVKNLYFF